MRTIPPNRFSRLIEVATETFILLGYRRAQMSNIAKGLGVAKGTLYLYVESKDALFDAVLRCSDGYQALPSVADLPLKTPVPGTTIKHVQGRITKEIQNMKLHKAVTSEPSTEVVLELREVIQDLYVRAYRNRYGIKLVDRCSVDHPELAEAWFGGGRWAQHDLLVQFLKQRIKTGQLRQVPSIPIAARHLLETITFWAVHRHWDPAPQPLLEEEVEPTITQVLTHGLLQGT